MIALSFDGIVRNVRAGFFKFAAGGWMPGGCRQGEGLCQQYIMCAQTDKACGRERNGHCWSFALCYARDIAVSDFCEVVESLSCFVTWPLSSRAWRCFLHNVLEGSGRTVRERLCFGDSSQEYDVALDVTLRCAGAIFEEPKAAARSCFKLSLTDSR
jgi:hypothetical protein